jgi:hypothetical protein
MVGPCGSYCHLSVLFGINQLFQAHFLYGRLNCDLKMFYKIHLETNN